MKNVKDATDRPETMDALKPEYRFNYSKAKPNRFASHIDDPRVVVMLDPDVSDVFKTPDSVNEVLRALINTMPKAKRQSSETRATRTRA